MSRRLPLEAIESLKREEWFVDPDIVDQARLFVLSYCPSFFSERRSAVTLGHLIIFTKTQYYDPHSIQGLALLAHELKHVEQYKKEGLLRFLWHYLRHSLKVGYDLERHPYEREATEFQLRVQAQLQRER